MVAKAARYYVPLAVFLTLAVFLAIGLQLDPRHVPSPLIDKPIPKFELPRLGQSGQMFDPSELMGRVWVLNVWASWCVACREEHDVVKDLSQRLGVTVVGLNYKDTEPEAMQWLAQLGDPYALSVVDASGQVGIDWGVYGVPETFVIDSRGVIRYKHIGPIKQQDVDDVIFPLIQELDQAT